jgi:hypothetical protein
MAFRDFPETAGDITRIEFEPLGTGAFRWNLFAGDARIHSEIGRPETLEAIFATTAALCTCPDDP